MEKKIKWGRGRRREGKSVRERDFIFYFPSLRFLLISMEIRQQVLLGAEGKVDIVTPQNPGVR